MPFQSAAGLCFFLWLSAAVLRAETVPADGPQVSVPTVGAVRAASLPVPGVVPTLNQVVLDQIRTMPRQGGYSVSHAATANLAGAVRLDTTAGRLAVDPAGAHPSYCSGATYLVFLKTVATLRANGRLPGVDGPALGALLVNGQRDGEGVWGRWNANGPGTARLFNELRLGRNFTRIEEALPGDFMKVFWTPAVGKKEHGHSVVYLGTETVNGVESVRFWSSNQGLGYGEKVVPRAKVSHALFSRLERPENISRAVNLPPVDPYLASLLSRESSAAEAREKCGAP